MIAPSVPPKISGNPDNKGQHLGQIKNPNTHDDKAKSFGYGIAKQEQKSTAGTTSKGKQD